MTLLLHTAVSLLTLLILFPGFGYCQVGHTVIVGAEGSFYNPPTVSAQLNDTVTFIFAGAAHSVTQGSFDNPCSPLKGGFNSGLTGIGNNASASPPTWTLTVTNVSQPIWFFCQSTVPSSHCGAGMVGGINPTSIEQYQQLVAAAKAVTGTPPPQPSLTLTGVGAVATNSPAPSTSPTTSSSQSTVLTTSTTPSPIPTSPTPTPTPTEEAASTSSSFEEHKGGIIAGIVVGAIVAIVLLMVLYFYLKRKRDQETIKDFFSYTVPPPANMTSRSGLAALPFNSSNASASASGSAPRPPPAPAVIPTAPRSSNEFDFSSGFPRGHAYAAVGLENKDPYSDIASTSDTYATDSIITTSAGGISGVSGQTGATRAAARRRPSQDQGFDNPTNNNNSRHGHTATDTARQPAYHSSTTNRDPKLTDNGGGEVNRPPSPGGPPPPGYHS